MGHRAILWRGFRCAVLETVGSGSSKEQHPAWLGQIEHIAEAFQPVPVMLKHFGTNYGIELNWRFKFMYLRNNVHIFSLTNINANVGAFRKQIAVIPVNIQASTV